MHGDIFHIHEKAPKANIYFMHNPQFVIIMGPGLLGAADMAMRNSNGVGHTHITACNKASINIHPYETPTLRGSPCISLKTLTKCGNPVGGPGGTVITFFDSARNLAFPDLVASLTPLLVKAPCIYS